MISGWIDTQIRRGLAVVAAGIVAGISFSASAGWGGGGISNGAAVGLGLGAFALGTAVGSAPYYNPYYPYAYYPPPYYYPPPAPGYYYRPHSCWDPYYRRYYAC
jgi:hypothetical protein